MGRPPQVTKEQVLRTAREAFAERGFEGTTLALIGSRMGVSAAAILRYAPTKDALFRASMAATEPQMELPVDFLARLTGSENPRPVLRRLARQMVPFLEAKMGEGISLWMRAGRQGMGAIGVSIPSSALSVRERVFKTVGDYFARAVKAKKMRLKDPHIAAMTFLGSLHAYAFMHRVLKANPPIPFDRYLDSLMDVWTNGAIRAQRRQT
jgi:AcrR family transcriptional regulator